MKNLWKIPLFAFIGGILYRLRGGVLKDWFPKTFGTQLSRLAWSWPTAVFMSICSGSPWWMAFPLIVSNFVSMAFIGTGQYLDNHPLKLEPDWLGIARTMLAAAPIAFFNLPFAFSYGISGILHDFLYWLGFRTKWGSQAGEVFVGAFSWAVIASLSFLN